jgi:lysophospholipase L1-like esterase
LSTASNLTIYSPSNLSIKTSPDVTIQALAINFPSDWETEFIIDGDTDNPIRVNDTTIKLDPISYPILDNMSFAEHTIQARIVDGLGNPQTSFIQIDFGIGNYNLGFGDSITEAQPGPFQNDDYPDDDISNDGRNGEGGYQPILNNLLTTIEGRPQTVENEGIGGNESIDGLARVHSVLAAHPDVQRILILFGTNDSSGSMPVPSGLSTDPPDPGSFKYNMQRIIDAIDPEGTGRIPVLAKVPMRFGDISSGSPYTNPESHPKNLLIEDYNAVVDELKALNPMIEIMTGPPLESDNFFTYYRDLPRVDGIPVEFADNLHPNGVGFQSMARLWCETLTGFSCQ